MKSERLSAFTDGCKLLPQTLWAELLTSLMNLGVKRCNAMLSVSTYGLSRRDGKSLAKGH